MADPKNAESLKSIRPDLALSKDAKTLHICQLVSSGQQDTHYLLEEWDLSKHPIQLKRKVTLDKDQAREGEIFGPFKLIPSSKSPAPSHSYALLQHGHCLRLGTRLIPDPYGSLQRDSNSLDLLSEYWESFVRRGDYAVVSRRVRPHDHQTEQARQKSLAGVIRRRQERLNEGHRERHSRRRPPARRGRRVAQYDPEMDFDNLPESEPGSDGFDSDAQPRDLEESGSDFSCSEGHVSSQEESENLSDKSQGSTQSLSEFSAGSLSDSTLSTNDSIERFRAREILDSSSNPLHQDELIKMPKSTVCDTCGTTVQRWMHCFDCEEGVFDLCSSCVRKGQWCFDKSHQLLETDMSGPITWRCFSNWMPSHEIRVYEVSSAERCVFEFSAENEKLLHGSQPVLHPASPLLAWAMSPTKLLIASFEGDNEVVIQKLKSFEKGGRKLSVDLQFSSCGAYLYVATVEAIEVGDETNKTTTLSMQVAILRLRFKNQSLRKPIAILERHYSLPYDIASDCQALPYKWTWTASEVYLTLAAQEQIRIYRTRIGVNSKDQPELSPFEVVSVSATQHSVSQPLKAQVLPPREGCGQCLVLVNLAADQKAEARCFQILGDWSFADKQAMTIRSATKTKR